jgi:hypothetical protein
MDFLRVPKNPTLNLTCVPTSACLIQIKPTALRGNPHHGSVMDLLEASNVQEAEDMGRRFGSPNRQKPFTDTLRMEIYAGGMHEKGGP